MPEFTDSQQEILEYFKNAKERNTYKLIFMDWRWTPTGKKSAVICWRRHNHKVYERSEKRLFTAVDDLRFDEKLIAASNFIGCAITSNYYPVGKAK